MQISGEPEINYLVWPNLITQPVIICSGSDCLKRLDEIKLGEYALHFDFSTNTLVPCMVARTDAGKHRTSDTHELFEFENNIVLRSR